MRTLLLIAAVWLVAAGCSDGYAPSSSDQDGADVRADAGADVDPASPDTEPGADTDPGDTPAPDTAPRPDADDEDAVDEDTGSTSCVPNHDGLIERDEVTVRAGLHATFRVAEEVSVDVAGTEESDGSRVWDLSGSLPGDHSVLVELRSLEGTWFGAEFPEAEYFSRLSDSEDEHGVFGVDDDGLYLQGVVTPDEDGYMRTELAYEPPAQILKFPLEQGSTWSTEADMSGWYNGGWWTGTEDYQSQVDAHGTLKTPFGDFEVLRVRTDTTRTVGLLVTEQILYTFVAECFGTVATIRSKEDEDDPQFDEAAEVRRLSQ
jgi:hypothetical protein